MEGTNKVVVFGMCIVIAIFVYIVFGKLPPPTVDPPVRVQAAPPVQPRVEPVMRESRVGVERTMTLKKGERSAPIIGYSDECIRAWGRDPDGDTFETYVRGVNEEGWYPFAVWKAGGAPFKAPGFYMFEGKEEPTKITYVLLKAGSCGERR